MSSDPNKHEKELMAKGDAHQRGMDLARRIEKVREGIIGLPADDQDHVIAEAKRLEGRA